MDIKTYREQVKRLASERSGETVFNGSAEHAAVIMENLFGCAHDCVRIFTGDLNAKVYGATPVVNRARQFLGHSDHRVMIIVESLTVSGSHPLVEELADEANFEIFQLDRSLAERVNFHFSTADGDCFRFEREKGSHAAVAGFGDAETAEHLNGVFSQLLEHSTRIDKDEILN